MNALHYLLVLLLIVPLWKSDPAPETTRSTRPKNVILLIGDGMGISQMSTAYYYGDKEPAFSQFPVIGLIKTSSAKEKITDSAAGATAFACGEKTYNGAIGVDIDKNALPSLVDFFDTRGASSGVVATSSVTHATPASFYAHARSRNMNKRIAQALLESPLDFFAGGGSKYFDDKLRVNLAKQGWLVSEQLKEPSTTETNTKLGYLLAEDGMPKMTEGRGDYLTEAMMIAINFLEKNQAGFFLMTEGSQIDWGGHANRANYIVTEVLDFDVCVGAALDYAKRDGETLVIVTADHETGGFTLASKEKSVPFFGIKRDYNEIDMKFSTGGHSASMVPVLAYGPGATEFAGIYENTEIYHKIVKLMTP